MRAEILTTAAELFRARGYRATTLEELARRLGISKKTLYGHFRSKEDLLAAIFHRTMSLVEEGLATIRASRAAPAEQLREVIRHQVRIVVAEQAFLTVFFAEEASLPIRLRRAIARRKARYDHAVEAIVRRCGRLAVHPRLVVFALLGMSNWTHKWYAARGAWDAEYIAAGFIALAEHGYTDWRAGQRDAASRRVRRLAAELEVLALTLDTPSRRPRSGSGSPRRYGTRTISPGRR